MKKPVKLWLQALRSGQYAQAKEVLYDPIDNSFCCLGVACDVYNQIMKTKLHISTPTEYLTHRLKVVKEWLGLKTKNGRYALGNKSLGMLNDNGKSFKKIADIIEKNQDKLFVK